MRLLITGATGFIGSHVLLAALAAGHDVVAMRRSPSSTPRIPLPCQPEWMEAELHTLTASSIQGVDTIIHLASAGVSPQQASWNELVQTNVAGSLRLLELASECGVGRCVVAGTCHEYGNAAKRYASIPPDAPLEPQSAYACSKAAAYQLLRCFALERGLELFYGRIFSAFGEGQFSYNFWPSLQRAALAGEDFPMTSGEQIRDFIPVSAVAAHLLSACIRTDITPDAPLVVNIGSGVAMSLLSFAKAEWARLEAGGRLLPSTVAQKPDDITRYVADLTKLHPNREAQIDHQLIS